MKKFSVTDIINKAKQVHGDLYDYSLVEYKNVNHNITIICSIHGSFDQIVNEHLKGRHCPLCANINRKNTRQEKYGVDYIFQSPEKQILGEQTILEKYGVNKPLQNKTIKETQIATCLRKYGVCNASKNDLIKIKIINNRNITNLQKYGSIHSSQQHMIDIIPLIENYDWLYEQYVALNKTSLQIAVELNINYNTILKYLRKAEIAIKQSYKISFKANQWLEQIEQEHNIKLIRECPIEGTNYCADGFCEETNTIYEFYGDYWHGNLEVFDSEIINESTNCTMGELYQKTIQREFRLKELGYTIISVWENDYTQIL